MNAHTPGQWHYWDSAWLGQINIGTSVETCAVVFFDPARPDARRKAEANARLIAEAPAMLESLCGMVDMMNSGDESGSGSPWHIKAIAILARIEGKETKP